MPIISMPNGIGASLGDYLATTEPLLQNGDVWWVDSSDGDDTYDGRDRIKPLATIGQAITNSSAGDIIVCKDGHTETLTSAIALANLTLVGAGASGGYPTVKLTNNQSAARMFTCTGNSQILNIWMEEQAQACSVSKAIASGTYLRIRGCYIECGQNDDAAALSLDAGIIDIRNTTIISTSTSATTQPHSAIEVAGATSNPGLLISNGLVIDGGTNGWSNYHAIDCSGGTIDYMYIEALSLLRGSDAKFLEANKGYINAATVTGGSRIDWADIT